MGQCERMAEGNQLARALGCLDGGNAGDPQNIALGGVAAANEGQGFGAHENTASGSGDTGGVGFVADIYHVRLAGVVKMGQVQVGHGNLHKVTLIREDDFLGCGIIAPCNLRNDSWRVFWPAP